MSDVDQLFGRAAEAPRPRTALILGVVVAGLLVGALGFACTVIPGLGLLAYAWNVAEVDGARLAGGYYGPEHRWRVFGGRVAAWLALAIGFLGLFLQMWLLWQGAYHILWGAVAAELIDLLPDPPATP